MPTESLWTIYKNRFSAAKDEKGLTLTPDPPDYNDKMLDAAKDQISIISALLTGGYFALISIGDIKDVKIVIDSLGTIWKAIAILIILCPMIFWIVSLAYANLVYLSSLYSVASKYPVFVAKADGSNLKDVVQHYLSYSIGFMFLGLIFLVLVLLLYIIIPTPKG